MRKLGIIGGTSWSSTALYYEHINKGVAQRLGGLHSARLCIESLDLAPFAAKELSGDWEPGPKSMSKDDAGVWSYTTAPLEPAAPSGFDVRHNRTADGSFNDLTKPWMGMTNARFGRRGSPERTSPSGSW